MAVGVGTQALSSFSSAKAQQSALNAQAGMSDANAQLAEVNAQDAIAQGERDVARSEMQTAQAKGSQRAALAANGVDVTQGSPSDILSTTDYVGQMDANTIRDNALRTAWGYRTQGINYQGDAALKRAGASSVSPVASAANTLLTGAGQVASNWYLMSKAKG